MILEDDILTAHPQAGNVLNHAAQMVWSSEEHAASAEGGPSVCGQGDADAFGLPKDWDLLQLQIPDGGDSLNGPQVESNKRRAPHFKQGSDYCNGAYLITRSAARRALQELLPIGTPPHSDWSLDVPGKYLRRGRFCSYTSSPELFHQAGSSVDSENYNVSNPNVFQIQDRCHGHATCPRVISSCKALDKDQMTAPLLQEAAIA